MNAVPADFAAMHADARELFSHARLLAEIKRMGREIDAALGSEEALFITIMNGALIFAGHLALAIRAPLRLDYAHATRYHGTEGRALRWLRHPGTELAARTVLLVDDILDEGHTLHAVREHCRTAGAARVLVAVLCDKRHARRVPGMAADFVGVEVPDAFVYGFGLDWNGEGRNLPAIYAPGPA